MYIHIYKIKARCEAHPCNEVLGREKQEGQKLKSISDSESKTCLKKEKKLKTKTKTNQCISLTYSNFL